MNELNSKDTVEKKSSSSNSKEILDWIKYLVSALIIAILISRFVIVNAYIPTESMVSTIMPKDRIIANRLSYVAGSPQRGDIVIFKFPDDEKILYVKRIIGLPGETLEVKEGSVYINGEKLDEPYLKQTTEGRFGPYRIPEGKYFMMGDNRGNSRDSRYWTNKYVDRNKILGKVLIEYFPKFRYFGG